MKTPVSAQAKKLIAIVAFFAPLTVPAWAAIQTVTLSVPGMTCAACPITVKKALSKVDGVQEVNVSYKKLEAVVTFDDAKTTVEALTKAIENAGYPASVKQ
ncbi:MAG: mercury resistance system periplasmic binding protein MerP [Nitrosomonas oligotropha]|uniref:Periplasmic mercury ion-binding protein n=1 Tax=Nitrosomonas oligotropha TaxID=42354 RepID=A0A5C7VYW9_9PROT|nr:MAG: mercury resistance system periplasmic binding protein MerP [Nitrosomonas oligotropha]